MDNISDDPRRNYPLEYYKQYLVNGFDPVSKKGGHAGLQEIKKRHIEALDCVVPIGSRTSHEVTRTIYDEPPSFSESGNKAKSFPFWDDNPPIDLYEKDLEANGYFKPHREPNVIPFAMHRGERQSNGAPPVFNFDWEDDFIVTKEESEKIENPAWIVRDLIIRGHLIVIAAKPNGGKTTVFMNIAGQIVANGYEVYYVNSDISGGDAKHDIALAEKGGFKLLLPDLKGKTMDQVIGHLRVMSAAPDADFRNIVFIFDTLKKMTDVIGKSSTKPLFAFLRGLTSKGMTIVLLAHTNKYDSPDGMPVFEGVGDIRSDSDELIYFVPEKMADGSLIVSTMPDKVRGDFKPISFCIGADRSVKQLDVYVDVIHENANKRALENDADAINAINAALAENINVQVDIKKFCKDYHGISERTLRRVLKIYAEGSLIKQIWRTEQGIKNAIFYYPAD